MASRSFAPAAMRLVTSPTVSLRAARGFQTSARRLQDATPLPARKPVGAFRGGLVAPDSSPRALPELS